jgi:hypothetical protein
MVSGKREKARIVSRKADFESTGCLPTEVGGFVDSAKRNLAVPYPSGRVTDQGEIIRNGAWFDSDSEQVHQFVPGVAAGLAQTKSHPKKSSG